MCIRDRVKHMLTELLRLLLAVAAAYLMGKLVSKLKLPAILGWLLTGMVLGPHALGLVDQALLDAEWYNVAESVMECTAGLMIGTEPVSYTHLAGDVRRDDAGDTGGERDEARLGDGGRGGAGAGAGGLRA